MNHNAKCPHCSVRLVWALAADGLALVERPFVALSQGDVVRVADGPPMTVETWNGDVVRCVWFDKDAGGNWIGPFREDFDRYDLKHCAPRSD